ncbi:AraC family transcriptional regulator ligand-binding domain-containing protein (plasmid) [Bermanella sp. WJH001]|uniref:AraC family transcriptional regulator n=1 Tax=Bermanella sp. WJH001 TaxID=3048005 RepID=UPI0024BE2CEF|nr:AraC family transcriptional regulator [Bermanella sp. WJH001]MDJ1539452.1 AraC family transcriptional regulator ligand-binding domain-containing protein [Bermanella sp. WJH001]
MASIGTHYILTAIGGAKAKGIDTRALLKKYRIPEKPLKDPKARFGVDLVAKLYAGIALELNDEFMGFTEKPIKVGTFELMAEWVSHSQTLEELLQKGIRFYNQITDEVHMSLDIEDDHVYFTSEFRRPELDFEHFYVEYWHVIWHRFASWYIGKPIKLLGAYINYTPLDRDEFDLLFRCPTYLKSKYNRLVFHKKYLQEPLIKSQGDLQVFLRRAPIDMLTIPGEDTSLTALIKQQLDPRPFKEDDILNLPTSEELAKSLAMSEQTLRRKLNAEGSNYQQIKDSLRQELANKLLGKRAISIAKISKQLNFSEPRAFTRAFKQWSGYTPKEYRQQKLMRSK